MSEFNYTNTKVPAEGLKHKHVRKSPSLRVKYEQKDLADNLLLYSQ